MLDNMRIRIEKTAVSQAKAVYRKARSAAPGVMPGRTACFVAKKACVFFAVFGLAAVFMGSIVNVSPGRFAESEFKVPASASDVIADKPLDKAAPAPPPVDAVHYERLVLDTVESVETLQIYDATESKQEAVLENIEALETTAAEEDREPDAVEENRETAGAVDRVNPESAHFAAQPGGFVYSEAIPMSYELQAYTYEKCVQRGLEYPLVLALIWRESRFQTNAVNVNRNGTRDNGIMQINDVNKGWLYEQLGIDNLMDPYQNIDAGTAMLGALMDKYGLHFALIAYQFGESGMKQRVGRGQTTHSLIDAIYSQRDYYRGIVS